MNAHRREILRLNLSKIVAITMEMQRRKWQPPPVFLPGESHGWRRLAGRGPWAHRESDTTEVTEHQAPWKYIEMVVMRRSIFIFSKHICRCSILPE